MSFFYSVNIIWSAFKIRSILQCIEKVYILTTDIWNVSHTANILDAETATTSCVTHPVALLMHYVKLLAAANFWYNICNFKLQILQLYIFFYSKDICCNICTL